MRSGCPGAHSPGSSRSGSGERGPRGSRPHRLPVRAQVCHRALMDKERGSMGEDGARSEVATLGGGCFWCLEAVYDQLRGVTDVVSGYAGGHVANPSYEAVCTGRTGHAEVVRITFDPDEINYRDL